MNSLAIEALLPFPNCSLSLITFCLLCLIHVCLGAIGATFALGACTSARLRDKDDYMNAAVGGMLAGSIFGFKSEFL